MNYTQTSILGRKIEVSVLTMFQISKASPVVETIAPMHNALDEKAENYLTHPTLGLLYSVCQLEDKVELFTTIYAKRLFFLVRSEANHIKFESIGRQEARLMVEQRLYHVRSHGEWQEYNEIMVMYKQTFH